MNSYSTIIIVVVLLFLIIGCFTGSPSQKDIHPNMPILPAISSEHLILEALPTIKSVQYMPDGNIHAFGLLPTDTVVTPWNDFYLFVYNSNFELLETRLIAKKKKYISFIDPASNVYISERDKISQFSYPDYQETILPLHPISTPIEAILDKLLNDKGSRKEEYRQLKEAGKKKVIEKNNEEVSQEFQTYYQQHFKLDEIAYGFASYYKYVLFMKDGSIYVLKNYRGNRLKSSIKTFLEEQQEVVIYNMLHRKDKGCSIANTMRLDQQKAAGKALQKQLVQTGFGITETKNTFENWPNTGYTKGFYYYELQLGEAKATFKTEHLQSKRGPGLYLLLKENTTISFLSGRSDKWYVIKPK